MYGYAFIEYLYRYICIYIFVCIAYWRLRAEFAWKELGDSDFFARSHFMNPSKLLLARLFSSQFEG